MAVSSDATVSVVLVSLIFVVCWNIRSDVTQWV